MTDAEQQHPGSIITQVAADQDLGQDVIDSLAPEIDLDSVLRLSLRGTAFELTRRELSNLPDCILMTISNAISTTELEESASTAPAGGRAEAEATVNVDFSPECLQYLLDVFRKVAAEAPAPPSVPTKENLDGSSDGEPQNIADMAAVIVLREDLDYYCLPPSNDLTSDEMLKLKRQCGERLANQNQVFTILERGESTSRNDRHLIDMLCASGFTKDEKWGFRAPEPNKAIVNSLSLVRLVSKAHTEETPRPSGQPEPEVELVSESVSTPSTDQSNQSTLSRSNPPSSAPETPLDEQPTLELVDAPINHSSNIHKEAVSSSSSLSSSSSSDLDDDYDSESDDPNQQAAMTSLQEDQSLQMAERLLLLWRKPARKCWWSTIAFDDIPGFTQPVRVHLRGVWTLELSVLNENGSD